MNDTVWLEWLSLYQPPSTQLIPQRVTRRTSSRFMGHSVRAESHQSVGSPVADPHEDHASSGLYSPSSSNSSTDTSNHSDACYTCDSLSPSRTCMSLNATMPVTSTPEHCEIACDLLVKLEVPATPEVLAKSESLLSTGSPPLDCIRVSNCNRDASHARSRFLPHLKRAR